ncbi:hypothetical protein FAZ95_36340 [Trinickia violacea]|uniref:Uncharacterized protein n=1 Tax=Trinickia violacea TaxID=2571746 RepID=A0A4P8IYI6_9BURK|nr:hypothetical protein [Trinickia violacea]QCP54402.1 hypothetical protein FAZ95_36340 [Trinickia violacea]
MMARNRTEELKIVFALSDLADPKGNMLVNGGVTSYPRATSIGYLDALHLLIEAMRTLSIDTTFLEGGHAISAEALLKRIEQRGTWAHIETAELFFQFEVVGAFDHAYITVTELSAGAAGDWGNWVKPFLALDGFVQAWGVDVQYNYWQNVRDPVEYQIFGRNYSHLPMRSNGLLSSVQRMEIDISGNPGRWMLRTGYVESVGAVMWLGERFWARVGQIRKRFLNVAEWLCVTEPAKGIVQIRASDRCFVGEDTASTQVRLRALLYG